MASNIDLYLDANGTGLIFSGSGAAGSVPTLTRNDVYSFRLRVQAVNPGFANQDVSLSGTSLKLGIGSPDAVPTDGQYRLTLAGPVTSSVIAYNATTTQILTAVSGIAGQVTVDNYGQEDNAWIITAATNNTALSFGGDPYTLFPTSSVLISTRRNPTANSKAQQIIKLRRNPAVYADTFTAASTAGVVSLTKLQDGGSGQNETYQLSVGPDAAGGSLVLNYGANSTTAIAVGASAASAAQALSAVTGIGSGNISVTELAGERGYTISFVRTLGNLNVTTALTLDAKGIYYIPWRTATVTMATAELDELFAEADATTITPTLEIELTDGGQPKTLYQGSVTVRKDVITAGSVVPAAQASYYTKAEADALFVEDAGTGAYGTINADQKTLGSINGNYSVDWENRLLGDSEEALSVDWQNRQLTDPDGNPSIKWGDNALWDPANASTAMVWNDDRILYAYDDVEAIQFGHRNLKNPNNQTVLDWGQGYTTSVTLTFSSVPASGSTTVTAALTGAVTHSLVLLGLPSATSAGLTFQGAVSGTGVVKITAFNVTTSAVTQSAQTFRLTAFGY